MQDWDDDVDPDGWSDAGSRPGPSRVGLVLVAIILLVPFVLTFGGAASAVEGFGPGALAVALFFAAVAAAYLLVRRWLRRRLTERTFWSDRR